VISISQSIIIRFTPEGGQIVWRVMVEENRVSVSIEDTGEGPPAHDEGRLFHKFYQGDKSRSGQKGHSGLGLYIVKASVEKHGGTIFAENNAHGGATMKFYVTSLNTDASV
jgi:two-component system, OmpR family, lantibiotic biosynthesis sensor histidine kinase NisK/SpaK